jgi:LysM repeat protein
MGAYRQSSLRPLAPAAIVAFAIVLLIVVATSLSGGDDGSSRSLDSEQAKPARPATSGTGGAAENRRSSARRSYVVKPGDNLAAIAQRVGVELEELRALNPSLDPQGLVAGQRVKLPQPGG